MPNQSTRASINKKGAGPVAQSFSIFEHNRASGVAFTRNRTLICRVISVGRLTTTGVHSKCLLFPKAAVQSSSNCRKLGSANGHERTPVRSLQLISI